MKKIYPWFLWLSLFVGACSTTSSSGSRTLSPDKESAEPTQRPIISDSLPQAADTLSSQPH